jgi:uncharacterized SAM-binding protein YcdF (DUF218 family)
MLINTLATAALSPLGTALLLSGLAWLLGALGRRRLALALGGVALLWLYAWATPVASHALRAHLEAAHPPLPLAAVPQAQAMVVLGGAIAPPEAGQPYPNLGPAADRVWHAARLYHAGKAPVVVLSGGSDLTISEHPEAVAMGKLLQDLGVPASALLLEGSSRNTEQNARYSAALLRQQGVQRVLLVTSALHMPRALRHFEAQGLQVVPVATDHETSHTAPRALWQRWLPNTSSLDGSARAEGMGGATDVSGQVAPKK